LLFDYGASAGAVLAVKGDLTLASCGLVDGIYGFEMGIWIWLFHCGESAAKVDEVRKAGKGGQTGGRRKS